MKQSYRRPVGLMDKASASGAGDPRSESWTVHLCRPPLTKKDCVTSARVALRTLTKDKCRDPGSNRVFSLTLSQLSYSGFEIAEGDFCAVGGVLWGGIEKQGATHGQWDGQRDSGRLGQCDHGAIGR